MRRKARFTIPDMIGTAVLLFIFAVIYPAIETAVIGIQGSGPLSTAVGYTLPAMILVSILSTPFILAEVRREDRARRGARRRAR